MLSFRMSNWNVWSCRSTWWSVPIHVSQLWCPERRGVRISMRPTRHPKRQNRHVEFEYWREFPKGLDAHVAFARGDETETQNSGIQVRFVGSRFSFMVWAEVSWGQHEGTCFLTWWLRGAVAVVHGCAGTFQTFWVLVQPQWSKEQSCYFKRISMLPP